jgi:hypothetical protein
VVSTVKIGRHLGWSDVAQFSVQPALEDKRLRRVTIWRVGLIIGVGALIVFSAQYARAREAAASGLDPMDVMAGLEHSADLVTSLFRD